MWLQVQQSNPAHSSMRASTLTTAPFLLPIQFNFRKDFKFSEKPKGRIKGVLHSRVFRLRLVSEGGLIIQNL